MLDPISKQFSLMKTSVVDIGVHVFEQYKDLDWELEIVAFNLLSALSWKKFHGEIHLYCNQKYLDTLKKWNVDVVYDKIDVELLGSRDNEIDTDDYWAISKIIVIDYLSKNLKKFTILDNDLWINSKLNLNTDSDVMMYHEEEFDINHNKNVYIDFDFMITEDIKNLNLDKTILPTNTALLHINNTDSIGEWVNLCLEIARYNSKRNKTNNISTSSKMCFIEQRLLPMLFTLRGYKYSTFVKNRYVSHKSELQDGSEWNPRLDQLTQSEFDNFESIKHVWGLKKFFNSKNIREIVVEVYLKQIANYNLTNQPYLNIIYELIDSIN